jgi:hypothetical protein
MKMKIQGRTPVVVDEITGDTVNGMQARPLLFPRFPMEQERPRRGGLYDITL